MSYSNHLLEYPNDKRHLWDVFAINLSTGERRLMDAGMTERNAEAYIAMAVMRRGCDTEVYGKEPHGD